MRGGSGRLDRSSAASLEQARTDAKDIERRVKAAAAGTAGEHVAAAEHIAAAAAARERRRRGRLGRWQRRRRRRGSRRCCRSDQRGLWCGGVAMARVVVFSLLGFRVLSTRFRFSFLAGSLSVRTLIWRAGDAVQGRDNLSEDAR
jgi:hypothetical protein